MPLKRSASCKEEKKNTHILMITGSVTLHVALTADRLVITDHPPRHGAFIRAEDSGIFLVRCQL